jgi:hypothetical protein
MATSSSTPTADPLLIDATPSPPLRFFVVPFQRVGCRATFSLNALHTNRADVLARAVTAAIFVSGHTRNDSVFVACLRSPSSLPPAAQQQQQQQQQEEEREEEKEEELSWSVCGLHVRAMKPDERCIGSILLKSLPPPAAPLSPPHLNDRSASRQCTQVRPFFLSFFFFFY